MYTYVEHRTLLLLANPAPVMAALAAVPSRSNTTVLLQLLYVVRVYKHKTVCCGT